MGFLKRDTTSQDTFDTNKVPFRKSIKMSKGTTSGNALDGVYLEDYNDRPGESEQDAVDSALDDFVTATGG